ncbi:MAG: glycerophosphodiester phosphodiesterase [Firmicutes bacterium]|nr:glycerophosphodiester phosphodiesterase [Bacillota bacterium]
MDFILTLIKICFWLFFAWILLVMGRRWHPMWPVFYRYRYAHRGLHGDGLPENSLGAFRKAVEKGYGAELDVHLLKDGTLAVLHDSDLKRMTGKEGVIEDLTREELENCHLAGTEYTIPVFDDVLEIFEEKTPLIVELKTRGGNHKDLVKAVCYKLDDYRGDYCIESFDFRAVAFLRKLRPSVCRGQLFQNFIKDPPAEDPDFILRFISTTLISNIAARPDFAACRFEDRNLLSNRMCRRFWGVRGVCWTITSMEDLKACEAEGCIPIFEGFEPGPIEE